MWLYFLKKLEKGERGGERIKYPMIFCNNIYSLLKIHVHIIPKKNVFLYLFNISTS